TTSPFISRVITGNKDLVYANMPFYKMNERPRQPHPYGDNYCVGTDIKSRQCSFALQVPLVIVCFPLADAIFKNYFCHECLFLRSLLIDGLMRSNFRISSRIVVINTFLSFICNSSDSNSIPDSSQSLIIVKLSNKIGRGSTLTLCNPLNV